MHLHIVNPEHRDAGAGVACVCESVKLYFEALKLDRIFCEPNAFNVALNRTLQAAAVLKRIRASREPLVITQRGRAAAVMVSVEEYERSEHERLVLLLLARGEKAIAEGNGFSLDDVLAEADSILANG